jgi:hypothetical protein
MTTDISKQTAPDQNLTQSTISGSLTSRALFWTPRFVTGAPFSHNLPFSFWLTDVARPTRVMALGMTDGESYFGFCQALDKLNIAAMCSGFGTWKGTGKAVETAQEVPTPIASHNTSNYSDFSRVAWRDALVALKSVEAQTLDLLVVNLTTDIGDGDLFFDLAVRKMSDQGIIVIHDLSCNHTDPTKASSLETLRNQYPAFQFGEDNDAVMVVLVGTVQDDRLKHFAKMKTGTAEFNTVQAVFRQLGAGHYYAWDSETERRRAKQAQELAEGATAERDALIKQFATLNAAYEERSKKIASEQARLYDLQQDVRDRDAQLAQKSEDIVTLSKTMMAENTALKSQMVAERTALETQVVDLEIQVTQIEATPKEDSADIKTLERQLQTRFQELSILQREILAVEKRANAQVKAVKNTTSWRITAPLRAIVLTFRRKK